MNLATKIFLDGGDPEETRVAAKLLESKGLKLTGQTTNPTLIAKNALKELASEKPGSKLSSEEAFEYYQKTVEEMSEIIPEGAISIQVIGDPATLTADEMLSQARDRKLWIPNGVIKFPCTTEGLKAASVFCQEGPVNITLNFSQEQAAAVFAATRHHNYTCYISPFVGRLDDKGQNGMDVVANILTMYRGGGDGHVRTLTASVRTMGHLLYALWLKSDVVTIPYQILNDWVAQGCPVPPQYYIYDVPGLIEIPYKELTLDKDWTEYDIRHELTDAGMVKFWEDWKSIVA